MLEIDITNYWEFGQHWETSNSIANLGEWLVSQCWPLAIEQASEHHKGEVPIITEENADEVREHFKDYGAWESEEIDGWPLVSLEAMILQEISSFHNEVSDSDHVSEDTGEIDWGSVSEDKSFAGRFYAGDVEEGGERKIYMHIGI